MRRFVRIGSVFCRISRLLPSTKGLVLAIGLVISFALSSANFAQNGKVQLIASGKGRAIILADGVRMILTNEDSNQGNVILISADSEQVILNVEGQEIILRPDDVAAPIFKEDTKAPPENDAPVVLWSDANGFFYANGLVNNLPVKFLVDTGANMVTFNSPDADELGINYKNGSIGYASTASGIATLKSLKLEKITIDHITLYDVPANVILGQFPEIPLLGGSFLNRLDMNRVGTKMELNTR